MAANLLCVVCFCLWRVLFGPLFLSFVSWVNGIAPGDVENISRDVEAWSGAYSLWLRTLPREPKDSKTATQRQAPNRLHWRLAQGKAYELWLGAGGKRGNAPLKTYLQERPGAKGCP